MLTKDDKSWLVTSFVTRGEHRTGMAGLEERYSRIETKMDKVLNKLDKFVGNVADLDQENKMGAVTLRRHGIQIEELAKATKTKISR